MNDPTPFPATSSAKTVCRSRTDVAHRATPRERATRMPAPATTNATLVTALAGWPRKPTRYCSHTAANSIRPSVNHGAEFLADRRSPAREAVTFVTLTRSDCAPRTSPQLRHIACGETAQRTKKCQPTHIHSNRTSHRPSGWLITAARYTVGVEPARPVPRAYKASATASTTNAASPPRIADCPIIGYRL